MDGKRDGNNTIVVMGIASQTVTVDGVSYVAGTTPVPITVDPVSGYVRTLVNSSDGGTPNPLRQQASLDGNGKKTATAETDDADRTVTPLTAHNGALMVQSS